MAAKVEVLGGPETAAAFDKLGDDVKDLTATHEKVARARIPGIAARTPVLSGDLASSWDAVGTRTAGTITSPLAYAGVIESGWMAHNISPAAMIARTLEADQGELLEEYHVAILERARARGFRLE